MWENLSVHEVVTEVYNPVTNLRTCISARCFVRGGRSFYFNTMYNLCRHHWCPSTKLAFRGSFWWRNEMWEDTHKKNKWNCPVLLEDACSKLPSQSANGWETHAPGPSVWGRSWTHTTSKACLFLLQCVILVVVHWYTPDTRQRSSAPARWKQRQTAASLSDQRSQCRLTIVSVRHPFKLKQGKRCTSQAAVTTLKRCQTQRKHKAKFLNTSADSRHLGFMPLF